MLAIRAVILKMLDRKANKEDPYQTAFSLKLSDLGLHCFLGIFDGQLVLKN